MSNAEAALRSQRRLCRGGLEVCAQRKLELAQHVLGPLDELGAFADEFMATAGQRVVDGAGDGEHLAALLASCWAVMSEPLCRAASTTSVPRDRPLMMRFRCGKCARGRRARRKFRKPGGRELAAEAELRRRPGMPAAKSASASSAVSPVSRVR